MKNEQRLSPARPAGGRKKMGGKRRNASGACTRSLKQKVSGAVNGALYSKLETDREGILHHIRMEWSVETMCWLLDVHFSEDQFRIEEKYTAKPKHGPETDNQPNKKI